MSSEKVVPIRPTGGAPTTPSFFTGESDGSQWVKIHPDQFHPSSGSGGGSGASPPTGNDGDDMKTPFENLKQNVNWLNKIVGGSVVLALGAFVGLFFILDDRIADRFDNADKQIATVTEQISDLRVEATKQDAKLDKILESINAPEPEPSPQGK